MGRGVVLHLLAGTEGIGAAALFRGTQIRVLADQTRQGAVGISMRMLGFEDLADAHRIALAVAVEVRQQLGDDLDAGIGRRRFGARARAAPGEPCCARPSARG